MSEIIKLRINICGSNSILGTYINFLFSNNLLNKNNDFEIHFEISKFIKDIDLVDEIELFKKHFPNNIIKIFIVP